MTDTHVSVFPLSLPSCRSLVATQPEDKEAVLTGQQARRPVAWLLLRPPRTHHRGPLQASAPVALLAL